MTLFDPFADMTRLRNQISRMIEETAPQAGTERERGWRPAVDVLEDDDALTLMVDLPGIERETLDVQVTGEELTVRGERRWRKPEKGAFIHGERPYGQFVRVFRIGIPVQQGGVQASYVDGVLTVRLPKAEAVKPRRIEVQLGPGANATPAQS
jgi:HSP20 family protein